MFGAWGTKHEPTWALRQLLLFFGSNISNSSPLSCWSLQRKKWSFKGSRLDLKIREREREIAVSRSQSASFSCIPRILQDPKDPWAVHRANPTACEARPRRSAAPGCPPPQSQSDLHRSWRREPAGPVARAGCAQARAQAFIHVSHVWCIICITWVLYIYLLITTH